MKRQLTAIIEREGDGYVSLCPELDIASQGDTIEEARHNLREALELFFESASKEEINERLHGEVYITQIEVAVASIANPFGERGLSNPRQARIFRSSASRESYRDAGNFTRYYSYRSGS